MFVMTYVIVIDMAYIIKSEWFHVFLRYLGEKSGLKSFKTKAQLEEVRKNVLFYVCRSCSFSSSALGPYTSVTPIRWVECILQITAM